MHKGKILIITLTLVLLGIGCASDTEETNETHTLTETATTTSPYPTPTINDPGQIDLVLIQRSYIYCQNQKNAPILKFDLDSARTKLFCALPDGRNCDARAFYEGTCPGENEKLARADGEEFFEDETCTLDVKPICGTDGFTYVNKCIAKLQQIDVAYEGQCGVDGPALIEEPRTDTSGTTNNPVVTRPTGGSSAGSNIAPSGNPVWIDILIDLATKESTKPHTTIESCTYNGKKHYLKTGTCKECFSVLYNNNGEVMCYPGNDLRDECPNYLNINTRGSACRVIWSGK